MNISFSKEKNLYPGIQTNMNNRSRNLGHWTSKWSQLSWCYTRHTSTRLAVPPKDKGHVTFFLDMSWFMRRVFPSPGCVGLLRTWTFFGKIYGRFKGPLYQEWISLQGLITLGTKEPLKSGFPWKNEWMEWNTLSTEVVLGVVAGPWWPAVQRATSG